MMERHSLQELTKRLAEPRRFIQVLAGARQTGKTTLVLQALEKIDTPSRYETADAVPSAGTAWLSALWQSARLQMKAQELSEFVLVIDEVQKLHNWSETVKKEWDEDTRQKLNLKVVLLGSSRLLLQQRLTESLAGRFELMPILHWSFSEMKKAFDFSLEQYIYFGGYPGSAPLVADENRWRDYIRNSFIETSIAKDILMLTRVDKPALLRQLFELGASYSTQILSYNKVLGQLLNAGNTTTLAHYLTLLDNSGLLGGIEKYTGSRVSVRSSSPKFQVYNNALHTVQTQTTFAAASTTPDVWGRMAESAVGAHLLNHAISKKYELYYWREANLEVDFVLKKDEKLIALEVKSGVTTTNKGMGAFIKKYPQATPLVVGTGGLPIADFLNLGPENLF